MKKLWFALVFFGLLATPTQAQSPIYPIITQAAVAVNVSTIATTKLITGGANTRIYLTAINIYVAGIDTITFEYGTTGTNCASGTTSITGPLAFAGATMLATGSGAAPILVVPPGNDLCIVTSAAIAAGGFVSYAQF